MKVLEVPGWSAGQVKGSRKVPEDSGWCKEGRFRRFWGGLVQEGGRFWGV